MKASYTLFDAAVSSPRVPRAFPAMAASRPTGSSALQFRVMRLPRPTLEIESPLRFAAEDLLGTCVPRDSIPHPSSEAFERRLDLFAAEDASGMTGMLLLPQNFGVVHLGETFASYVSVSNSSDRVARDVAIKVELQTNRRRVALFDNAAAPLPAIQPGASYDFIVEHDLKELGAHTLACTVEYAEDVPAGVPADRRRHPQHFKFDVANPVAVRTKTRPGRDGATFLETCVENATKAPLLLSAATFEPAPRFTCRAVLPPKSARANGFAIPDGADAGGGVGLPSLAGRDLRVLDAAGGAAHFLFELREKPRGRRGEAGEASEMVEMVEENADASAPPDALGKLEIRWRGRMGETGRLQTQQILGAPKPAKPAGESIELSLDPESMKGLDTVTLAAPVSLAFVAKNANAAAATPELELVVLDDDAAPADDAGGAGENSEKEKGAYGAYGFRSGSRGDADGALVFEASSPGIAVDGARAVRLGRLAPGASARAVVTVVPLRCGARRAPGVAVREATEQGRTYAYMRGIELVVKRA